MRLRRAMTVVGAALAAIAALAAGRWPDGGTPSARFEARKGTSARGLGRPGFVVLPGPSAEDESGIAAATGFPARPRPSRMRPQGEPPQERRDRPTPARISAEDGDRSARAAPAGTVASSAGTRGTGAAVPGSASHQVEPQEGQAALPPSGEHDSAPSPAAAPPSSPPAEVLPPPVATAPPAPLLTPPVPVELSPPKHPLPYRMVVEAPGLAAGARFEAVEARVRLRVTVRADGAAGRVEIAASSGRAELDAAALEAARQWRFLPARRNGEPIESVALIWVAFVVGP